MRRFHSHGDGLFEPTQLRALGQNVIFEPGVRVFHPETISIGNNVYVGHETFLKGHPHGTLDIASDVWIGQRVFIHSAGGVVIGPEVGIGPGVTLLSSSHQILPDASSILDAPLAFAQVTLERGCDIGAGAMILPGVRIGEAAQVGAGAVVTKDVPARAIVAGNPARVLRYRSSASL